MKLKGFPKNVYGYKGRIQSNYNVFKDVKSSQAIQGNTSYSLRANISLIASTLAVLKLHV